MKRDVLEISTLEWPRCFGEATIIDPTAGLAKGTVHTETQCTFLMVHRSQLETFKIDKTTLERVKLKSVVYPSDEHIGDTLRSKEVWSKLKDVIVEASVDKVRWPQPDSDIKPFHVPFNIKV